jgi:hypothetical protein
MNSYYDTAAKEIIHSLPAPYSNIRMDVVEYKDKPGIVVLRFFANNLYSFSDNQLVSIAEWMNELLKQLNSKPLLGNYTWECVEYDQG